MMSLDDERPRQLRLKSVLTLGLTRIFHEKRVGSLVLARVVIGT